MNIAAFHIASFLSAFLLFLIQPVLGKELLPGFGGSFAVWGACMVFFQAVLVAGYGWSHGMRRVMTGRRAALHLAVLAVPLLCIRAGAALEPREGAPLFVEVLRLAALKVGLPFFALSTNSIVLQNWLASSRLSQRENPYVLYAASNAGSILALLCYPFMVEPLLALPAQWTLWWSLYALLIVCAACCVPWRATGLKVEAKDIPASPRQFVAWIMPAAAGCAMLLAVTNMILFDVASIPLFWTLPLSVYLLSFVLLFKRRPWNPPWLRRAYEWAVPAAAVVYILLQLNMTFPLAVQLVMQLVFLFVFCMGAHGGLAEARPADTRQLSAYYLAISVGGLLGSLLVGLIVPLCFSTLIEFPLALALGAGAAALLAGPKQERLFDPRSLAWAGVVAVALLAPPWLGWKFHLPSQAVAAMCALPVMFALLGAAKLPLRQTLCLVCFAAISPNLATLAAGDQRVIRLRNFYGIYKVADQDGQRWLMHGSTAHGREWLDPKKAATPLSYYHPSTPIGVVMNGNPLGLHEIGMIGLGAGSLAAYLGAGQHFTVYELDPDNLKIADAEFNYLKIGRERGAKLDFVFGDGRVQLRKAAAGAYDLLILDAFSSDAIPVHLLTIEAMREYFRALKPGGILMLHVSNKFVSLEPLVASLARELGYPAARDTNAGGVADGADMTYWAAVARDEKSLAPLVQKLRWLRLKADGAQNLPRAWTDQYSNLPALFFWD